MKFDPNYLGHDLIVYNTKKDIYICKKCNIFLGYYCYFPSKNPTYQFLQYITDYTYIRFPEYSCNEFLIKNLIE